MKGEESGDLLNILILLLCRQENTLSVSTLKFPNKQFPNSPEFVAIVKKLYWSCRDNKTRFGYKRRGIMKAFPGLCGFYDELFYSNAALSEALHKEDQLLLLGFLNDQGSSMEIWTAFDIADDLVLKYNLTLQQYTEFQEAVLAYCKANLVKIIAYMPSPYITTYKTDQVRSGSMSLKSFPLLSRR